VKFYITMSAKFHCGQQIRKLRVNKGITQIQLGEMIGKTQALVSFIEKTGKANEDVLQAISRALNVSIEQILNATEEAAFSQFNESLNKDALYKRLTNEITYLKSQIEDYKEIIRNFSLNKRNDRNL
jgi:transcriptional regulator with XRE-family HTH domain